MGRLNNYFLMSCNSSKQFNLLEINLMKSEEEEKYNKKANQEIMPGNKWLRFELTKYFDIFALGLLSLARLTMGSRPIAAQYMFPIISLKLYGSFWQPLLIMIT